jgi:pimeloyl-ACP methyl ester carboxylesterase
MAPTSPEADRWETLWHYMQSGPGVFKGDLYFYRGADGDIGDRLSAIDTRVCPLYLLTGEYDYSVSPEDTRAAAERIQGAKFSVMPRLGHFPMSENPALFLSYLKPVLAEIRSRR